MKDLPKSFNRLFILITLLALVIWVRAIYQVDWTILHVFHLLIFGLLAAASESLPVSLPRGGYVTVSFAVFICGVILFPLGVSTSVAAIGGLFVFGKDVEGEPF